MCTKPRARPLYVACATLIIVFIKARCSIGRSNVEIKCFELATRTKRVGRESHHGFCELFIRSFTGTSEIRRRVAPRRREYSWVPLQLRSDVTTTQRAIVTFILVRTSSVCMLIRLH